LSQIVTVGVGAVLACVAMLLDPAPVAAWGPGTHIALGEGLLGSLYLLPPTLRVLLERFPIHFLYGSIAADISFAKKYAPVGRHCHHWEVGEEILASADNDPMRAVAYGYLAHLAADTVAHNIYVPRRLLLTQTTRGLGHAYWEHRMDVHVGEEYLGKARTIVLEHDHSSADALFDEVLSRTLFGFQTNRRIFRGMIRFQGNDRWKRVFDQVLSRSRFDLPDDLVAWYVALSFDAVVDYLVHGSTAEARGADPIGDVNLRLAKGLRRRALASGGVEDPAVVIAAADDFFPIPTTPRRFAPHATLPGPPPVGAPNVATATSVDPSPLNGDGSGS
jgi:hypothetical protein